MSASSVDTWLLAHLRGALGRSALIGLLATAVDLAVLWLLTGGIRVTLAEANAPALLAGLLVQFFGNKHFAFRDRSHDLVRQGARFAAVEAWTFALNLASFHILAVWLGLTFVLARPLGEAIVYLGFSFPQWRRVFEPPGREDYGKRGNQSAEPQHAVPTPRNDRC